MSQYDVATAEPVTALEAVEEYRREVRFRALCDSIVASAMHDHGPVDPERAEQAACDIARTTAALLLATIYKNDAEIKAWKDQCERLSQIASDYMLTHARPIIIATETALP